MTKIIGSFCSIKGLRLERSCVRRGLYRRDSTVVFLKVGELLHLNGEFIDALAPHLDVLIHPELFSRDGANQGGSTDAILLL